MNSCKLFIVTLLITLGLGAAGQSTKLDKIYLVSGEIKEGRVAAQSDSEIQFTHKGETLIYAFKKEALSKIEFSSGRVEVFSHKTSPETAYNFEQAENKVAVLPMAFSGEGNSTRMEEMRYRLQEMTIEYLQKNSNELKLQEASVTNALLRKKGISEFGIKDYTPTELARMLGVEYVVMGSVSQITGNTTTSTNNTNSGNTKVERKGTGLEVKKIENNTSFSNTSQNIQTDVMLYVYNDKGEKIFSKSKHSMLSTPEAYKNALHYLLKRTPIYKR